MMNEFVDSANLIVTQTKSNLLSLALITLIPWVVFFITRVVSDQFLLLGIFPRRVYGIPGIFFAPLLHANFNHLFFNTIPFVVLSNFILISGLHYYLTVTFMITLFSGVAIWCFGKPGLHIGASALITGYWGFLITNIYQHGTIMTIILGLLSLYYFSGLFLGIFPSEKRISWEGHLFGLLAGIATSYLIAT